MGERNKASDRNTGNQGGNVGIKVGMREIKVGMRGIRVILCENLCLLLRLKSRSARGAFHHPTFMGSCPTISHTYFALSTKWTSSPSRK